MPGHCDLNLIEEVISKIRAQIGAEILKEEDGKYKRLEERLAEITALKNYIHKGYEEWPKQLIHMLDYLTELIKTEISKASDDNKKKKLEDWKNKIYGMTEGIKRELLYMPDVLLDRLKNDGYRIAKNETLSTDINRVGFRLLEKVRLGQRDDVLYMLLRTFTTNEVKLPDSLIDAIKTKYDDSLFKSFIYAFLAPILGKEKEGGEE